MSFSTKLDISMQYYTFELYQKSQELCTIMIPYSKCKHVQLPMGVQCSCDIAKAVMESVLSGLEDEDVYIYDVGVFSKGWKHDIELLS